jgi:DNA repair protein RadD
MELRDYQQESIDACYRYLQMYDSKNPCIVIPTGGGKSPVIGAICRDAVLKWNSRVLILAHVKELLEQNAAKIKAICPTINVGIYSAGLKRRDTKESVIVAGIQSVYNKADELGNFDLVLVDEAHLIPESGEGQYRTLLTELSERNCYLRIIGLTATPYRLGSGYICRPDGLINEICYEIGVRDLVKKGWLCPLVGKIAMAEIDTSDLSIKRGEFVESEAEAKFTDQSVVTAAVQEILQRAENRKSVLIFCQTVLHARLVCDLIMKAGQGEADVIEGNTDSSYRAEVINDFRSGLLRFLVNVNVLTTGFDAPNVDCVCLLRATTSPGLYYQMLGRGFRLHPDKKDCLVLDFGQNIMRHGPVDRIQPKKEGKGAGAGGVVLRLCSACRTVNERSELHCINCGELFPIESVSHNSTATAGVDPISDGKPLKPIVETLEVQRVSYQIWEKRNATPDTPKTLRVNYHIAMNHIVSEWVCPEHTGFARDKAERWWSERCAFPMPETAVECYVMSQYGLIAEATEITTKKKPGEQYDTVASAKVGEIAVQPLPCRECGITKLWALDRAKDEFDERIDIVCAHCNAFESSASLHLLNHYGIYVEGGKLLEWNTGHQLFATSQAEDTLNDQLSDPFDSDIPF